MSLADKMPIQHWIPIVSQAFKVRISCIYDRDVVPPLPQPTSFANYLQ